jgi:hypothetical protein
VSNGSAPFSFAYAEVHCVTEPGVNTPVVVPGLEHFGIADASLVELQASVEAAMPRAATFAIELRVLTPGGMRRLATAHWEMATGLLQMTGPTESIVAPSSRVDSRTEAVRWTTYEFEVCLGDHAWDGCNDQCCVEPPSEAVIRCHTSAGQQDSQLTALTTAALDNVFDELEAAVGAAAGFRLELHLDPDSDLPYADSQWSSAEQTLKVECPETTRVDHAQDAKDALLGVVDFLSSCFVELVSGEPGRQHRYDHIVEHGCAECSEERHGCTGT